MDIIEEHIKDWDYSLKVLKALLYLSSQDSDFVVPTQDDALSSEIVNATIWYIKGNAQEYNFSKKHKDPESHKYRNKLWKYFRRELGANGHKLNPKIKNALVWLTKKEGHWEKGQTGLELLLSMHTELPRYPSSASMPYKTVMQIEKKVLPSFTPEERKDLEGIAECMKVYIKQDLQDIKKHYSW